MSEKLKTVTMRIDPAIHQKLKIIAALQNKGMAEVITGFIDGYSLEIPKAIKAIKPKKAVKVGKPVKPKKKIKTRGTTFNLKAGGISDFQKADPAKTKKKILSLREQGLSFEQIANSLNEAGWPTLSGRGVYQKGTVSKLVGKWVGNWKAENDEKVFT